MKTAFTLPPFLFRYATFVGCVLSLVSTPQRCAAQDRVELLAGVDGQADPIPRKNYKSWSLFLANNPEWLLDQGNDKLNALYQKFTAFGNAIGPDNLAVWFWSQRPQPNQILGAVDVVRSAAFCKRLNLKPSEGPYVLVMTEYPGACVLSDSNSFPKNSTNLLVIKLNGTDAASTTRLLGELVDGLLLEDLSKLRPKPEAYVDGWRRAFRKVNKSVVTVTDKITVSFDAGPLKIGF